MNSFKYLHSTAFSYKGLISAQTLAYHLLLMLFLSSSCMAKDDAEPTKIVSAGGSVTEILFALGAQNNIVATDTSSLYPYEAKKLPKVGYYRQLSAEGVLSTQASTLFAASGVGPKNVLAQLQGVGMSTHIFSQDKSLEGLYSLITEVGEKANKQAQANELLALIKQEIQTVTGITKQQAKQAHIRPVFLMSANDRGLMAAGTNTVPNLIMEIAGTQNPFSSIEGFKPISAESFLSLAPTHVLLPVHQSHGRTPAQICALPVLAKWASEHGCKIYLVDSLLFLGLGPRLPKAVEKFADITLGTASDIDAAIAKSS